LTKRCWVGGKNESWAQVERCSFGDVHLHLNYYVKCD
jgi:hypothetical protein